MPYFSAAQYAGIFSPKFRRELPTLALTLVRLPAMVRFPEKKPVYETARPCPHAVLFPPPCPAAQGFVAISAYGCVEKLVYSNQHVFDVLSSRNFHVFPPKMSFMQANDTLNFLAISFLVHFPRRFFICMTCSSVSFAELFFSPLFIHEYL